MSKFILFALVALLATTLISGATLDKKCGRHGDPCSSVADCCPVKQMACNRFANKCQIQITAEELQEAKANLKHVKPEDRKGYTDIYH